MSDEQASEKDIIKIHSLAQLLRDRISAGIEPYVLFLGAGASLSSGCFSGSAIISNVLSIHAPDFDINSISDENKFAKFAEIIEHMSQSERFVTLQQFINSITPSAGYKALARLIREGYFRLIFTTNFDHLLEKAIQSEAPNLRMEKLVVGREKEEHIAKMIEYRNIDLVIVKLHGDLNSRILAYTEVEVIEFCETVEGLLTKYMSEDIIIVGSRLQDHDIRRCLKKEGGSLWYINPEPPIGLVKTYMKARGSEENFISGGYGLFDDFFQQLQDELIKRTPENFLRTFGIQVTSKDTKNVYAHVGELFVEPKLYRTAIRPILEEHHIVFILGDPHVGKTYTAVHILWELYQAGYEPLWISTSQISSLFQIAGGNARLQEEYLKARRAVYLEDPFGRTTPLDIQEFATHLHNLIVTVKQMDVRVIITSRSNIFNAVIQEKYAKYIVTLSQELKLGKAYENENLKDIVRRYALFYDAEWSHDKNWQQAVDVIASRLVAPHNIELFVRATRHLKVSSAAIVQLDAFRDVTVEFGREISRLSLWQKGFLLYVYFFCNFTIPNKITKRLFEAIARKGIFGHAPPYAWDCGVTSLGNYLTLHEGWRNEFYSFRHPSLEEGFDLCVDAEPDISEVVKKAVMTNIFYKNSHVRIAAFKCFLHYSYKFGNTEWARSNMKKFLESSDTYIRESSRDYLVLEYDNLFQEFKEEVQHYAEKYWNERFLLKLLIGANLEPEFQKKLAKKLVVTWDTWIRDRLACNLNMLAEDDELLQSLSLQLLKDDSIIVRRTTAVNLLSLAILNPEPKWHLAHLTIEYAKNDTDYGFRLKVRHIFSKAFEQSTKSNSVVQLLKELHNSLDLNGSDKHMDSSI